MQNNYYKATKGDKHLVCQLLSEAFAQNGSVLYLVGEQGNITKKINALMAYSFEMCMRCGEIWISKDKDACLLFIYPERQKTYISLDLYLIYHCVGLFRIRKILARQAKIKRHYPGKKMLYFWFLGVKKEAQGKGKGSQLLKEGLSHAEQLQLPVYLETSMPQNLPLYHRHGFETYATIDFDRPLYLLRKNN